MSKRVLTPFCRNAPRETRVSVDNVTTRRRNTSKLNQADSRVIVTFRSPLPSHRWRQEERHVQMGTWKGIDKFERKGTTTPAIYPT
jgi:hypothetical protein